MLTALQELRLLRVSFKSNIFKLSSHLTTHFGYSHLVEFELKAKDVAEGEWLTHVGLDERQKELILIRSTLVHLQDDVQYPVRIQVETSCGQKK